MVFSAVGSMVLAYLGVLKLFGEQVGGRPLLWLGFFAWYRALAIGGTVRVSQVQLLQPFLSLLFCVPVLGESIDRLTLVFSLLIIATVFWSKRQAVAT